MRYIQLSFLILGALTASVNRLELLNQTNQTIDQDINYIAQNRDNRINTDNLENNLYNYSNMLNDTRTRIQESKIHLKLRKQLNLNQKYNLTQIVTFYNQSQQQYQTVVLFNETKTNNPQTPNQYYYYQNTTLITLTKEYNVFGNVVYRSIDYNFSIVIEGNSNDGSFQNNSYELHGTIVQDRKNFSGKHSGSGYMDQNMSNQYINANSMSQGSFNFANGQGSVDESKYTNSYESTSQNFNKNFSDQIQYQDNSQNVENHQTAFQYYGDFDVNENQKYSSNKGKSSQLYDSYQNDQVISLQNSSIEISNIDNGQKNNGIQIRHHEKNNENTPDLQWSNSYTNNSEISFNHNNKYVTKEEIINGNNNIYYSAVETDYDGRSVNVDKNIQFNIDHENSTTIGQGQDNQTVSDGFVRNINNQENQVFFGDGNHSISAQGSGYLDYAKNQTHSVSNSVNGTTTTVVTVNGTTSDTTGSYYGGVPEVEQQVNAINMGYTNVQYTQQFTSLRGAKTQEWQQIEIEDLYKYHPLIPEEAIQAVNQKFNPQQEEYQFDQILNAQVQVPKGVYYYQIQLQFNNQEGNSRKYQVGIMSNPWTLLPDDIIGCWQLGN